MKEKTLGHIYALFTILVWGSCFVLTKVMLTAYTPTQIIPLRMGLAYLTLWALRPKTMKLPWKDELMFILIGITGGSFYFFLQNTAAAHTSAANVSILVSMSPILTVILAQLFSRKGEKLGKLVYIGAVVAIAGVVLVVLNGTLSFHLSPLGDLLALAAALMWAVYSILVKRYTERYDNFLVTRRVFLWAFLTSLPLVLLTDGLPSLTPLFTQPNILISWLFLGVFGNAVCFAIWNIAFKRLGVVVTNNYLYASPFVTVVVGWLLLDEKISFMSIIGAVLIIVLFVLFIVQGLLIAYKAENLYCTMVGIGIMAQIAWQVFCNIAVVTNTLPNTGISLPFFSSGGTSLILLLAEMGVMINIGRGGERARLERENLRAQREQREKEKSDNTIRLDPNMGY